MSDYWAEWWADTASMLWMVAAVITGYITACVLVGGR